MATTSFAAALEDALAKTAAAQAALGAVHAALADERARVAAEAEAIMSAARAEAANEVRQLAAEQEALRAEKERMATIPVRDNDVVELNVGGTLFAMKRSTLCLVPDSVLAAMFSGRHEDHLDRDAQGRYFLDFSPVCFGKIADFLRSKRIETPLRPAPAPVVPDDLCAEFDCLCTYLGLDGVFEAPSPPEPPVVPHFLGFVQWAQSAGPGGQTRAQQAETMDAAARAAFGPNARAASIDELRAGTIVGLPASNTFETFVIFKGHFGDGRQPENMAGYGSRCAFDADAPSNRSLHASSRGAAAVCDKVPEGGASPGR